MGALTLETEVTFKFHSSDCWHQSANNICRRSCVFNEVYLEENFSGPALYAVNSNGDDDEVRSWKYRL